MNDDSPTIDFECVFAGSITRVVVSDGEWSGLRGLIAAIHGVDRWVMLVDEVVAGLYGGAVAAQFDIATIPTLQVRGGDSNKSLAAAKTAYEWLAHQRADRHTGIIALGGGVCGDLAGFVAATWLRGVPWVNCPTTMLSMVDSCVGGKTAVNLSAGKNLVGAFHHPRLVFGNTQALQSLPDALFVDGLAESVKHAVALDASFLEWHERNIRNILSRDKTTLQELIARNLKLKAGVVTADEREQAALGRAVLNLGHTIGHALESASGFSLSHGACVSLGLVAEMELAVVSGILRDADRCRVEQLLAGLGLPLCVGARLNPATVIDGLESDKKRRGGRTRFAVPTGHGKVAWLELGERRDITSALRRIGIEDAR